MANLPETLATAALFLSFALAVLVAVDGWLGALGTWSEDRKYKRSNTLVYLFLAAFFTVMAVCAWYALASP